MRERLSGKSALRPPGGAPSSRMGRGARRAQGVLRRAGWAVGVSLGLAAAVVAGALIAPTESTVAYFSDTPKASSVRDGVEAPPWQTCAQSMSQASYGSKPWAHFSFDENTGLPQTSLTGPYFKDSGAEAWDALYFSDLGWNGRTPNVGNPQACRRDIDSRSLYLRGGTTLEDAQYVRIARDSQGANGPGGARWNTFSVNVWFKTNVSSGEDKAGVLAAYSRAGGHEADATDRVMYLDKSGRLSFEVYPGTYKFRATSGNYADNQWHMGTATLGPDGMCLYVDSRRAGSCDTTVTTSYQTNYAMFWRFGYGFLSDGFQGIDNGSIEQRIFKGYLDDASIWTRQLSAEEIKHMYRAGIPLR